MSWMETLQSLGWRPHFQAQIDPDDPDDPAVPARVLEVHRGRITVAYESGRESVALSGKSATFGIAVGDWVLVNPDGPVVTALLERFGLFQRKAAGGTGQVQAIAANVDTLFIVTSANRDFNVARLERYLAIAYDAGAYPIVVITKADLAAAVDDYVAAAGKLYPGLLVEALDARSPEAVEILRPWCDAGRTVALLGSSGVGKSTLINTLAGTTQDTRAVREDDQRGRHTTTSRSMHSLPDGGWLIDTPGMRELQLVDVEEALDEVFTDIAELAAGCRFADCLHEAEPGCAVLAAIEAGELEAARLRRYHKLRREDRRNTETVAERRSRDKQFGRLIKSVKVIKEREKGGGH